MLAEDLKLIKRLRDALSGLEEVADISRAEKPLDELSGEDLLRAGRLIYGILLRMRVRGLIDPSEIEELKRIEEESFKRFLGSGENLRQSEHNDDALTD